MGLAQCHRAAQGHGRAHPSAQTGSARTHISLPARRRASPNRTEQARQETLAQHLPAPSKWPWVHVATREAVEEGGATPAQQTKAAEPLGSGAVESTCRQYQCRFKRTGQFWSRTGDEALIGLETLWRNGRWHLLFPHAKPPSPANN